MFKKIAIGLIGILIIVAIAGSYLWSNIDSVIKTAIIKYGSEATATTVGLDKVKLSLTDGEGALAGLSVGSPAGFNAPKAFYLGSISVKVDTQSVTGNGPIVIDDITIKEPQVTYEVTSSGDSNLQTIARNAQKYAENLTGGKGKAPAESKSAAKSDAPGRKIIIKSLTVQSGQISIAQPLLKDRQLHATLPTIHMMNIGKGTDGATPGEIAGLLVNTISETSTKVAAQQLAQQLGNLKDIGGSLLKGAASNLGKGATPDAINNVGGQLKGLLGQ